MNVIDELVRLTFVTTHCLSRQAENEALKMTIKRLEEDSAGSAKLREEASRLYSLVELKTR